MKGPVNPPADYPPYELEFRSTLDDAWYTARVVLDGDTLVVKFLNFVEACDERFSAGDFQTVEAVDALGQRIRPLSLQVQDSECYRLVEGVTVCASFSFGPTDVRFYDAVVEAVHPVEHSFAKEEDECLCTFLLFWQHGPNEGNITSSHIEDICLVQHFAQLDSTVVSFLKLAMEKVKIASRLSGSVADGTALICNDVRAKNGNGHLSTDQNSSLSQQGLQVKDVVRQSDSFVPTKEDKVEIKKFRKRSREHEDKDIAEEFSMGETGSHHYILVENLERDLSPSSIMEFIHKQTCISPQAYVFPSLSSESYARGAIVLDCEKKLQKIQEFLNNPNHIVMSSRGRPWVVTGIFLNCGTFRTARGSLMPISQCELKNISIDDELKIAHRGAKEYNTAKDLRNLFMDFVEHQKRLHKRLALEEKKILQLSAAV